MLRPGPVALDTLVDGASPAFVKSIDTLRATYVTDASCYSVDLNNGSSPWNTNFYFGGSGYNASCP